MSVKGKNNEEYIIIRGSGNEDAPMVGVYRNDKQANLPIREEFSVLDNNCIRGKQFNTVIEKFGVNINEYSTTVKHNPSNCAEPHAISTAIELKYDLKEVTGMATVWSDNAQVNRSKNAFSAAERCDHCKITTRKLNHLVHTDQENMDLLLWDKHEIWSKNFDILSLNDKQIASLYQDITFKPDYKFNSLTWLVRNDTNWNACVISFDAGFNSNPVYYMKFFFRTADPDEENDDRLLPF